MAEMEYKTCPFCAWTRPIKYGIKKRNGGTWREVKFDKVDPGKVKILETRELSHPTGQKAGSIKTVDYTLLKDLPEELKNQIKNQCNKILKIISESEKSSQK